MVSKDSAEGYVMPANDHDTVSMSMVSWKLQQVSKGSYNLYIWLVLLPINLAQKFYLDIIQLFYESVTLTLHQQQHPDDVN